jgi:RNA polymerase sigma-70 factor (ECF subfamily)
MSPGGFPRRPAVQSDQRLLALAREGDERAFEALVRRHRRSLLRYCRRMGLSDARAEDVVQQSLLRAWLALARGGEVHAPKAWLYRTVHNTAVNALRSTRDHAPLEDGAWHETAVSAESDFEHRVAIRQTLRDVAGLPRLQREAIMLTAFDGRSHEEIALALGVTHGAVRGLLYRARTTLRDTAAAVVPPPVLLWASALLARVAPGASKAAELAAPAGSADVGGALAKGAALAATAAVLAVGTGVVPLPRHLAHHSKAAAQTLGIAPATAEAQTSPSSVTPRAALPQHRAGVSSDALHPARSGAGRRVAPAAAERRRSAGANRSRDGSHDGSGDSAANHGGEADLSAERERASRSGSNALQPAEGSPPDSAHGGGSVAECDHCSPASGVRDEAFHPSASPAAEIPAATAADREAPAEPQARD